MQSQVVSAIVMCTYFHAPHARQVPRRNFLAWCHTSNQIVQVLGLVVCGLISKVLSIGLVLPALIKTGISLWLIHANQLARIAVFTLLPHSGLLFLDQLLFPMEATILFGMHTMMALPVSLIFLHLEVGVNHTRSNLRAMYQCVVLVLTKTMLPALAVKLVT